VTFCAATSDGSFSSSSSSSSDVQKSDPIPHRAGGTLQLIFTDKHTPVGIVCEFDLHYVECFYQPESRRRPKEGAKETRTEPERCGDAVGVMASWQALRDLVTRRATPTAPGRGPVKPKRSAKAARKGFSVPASTGPHPQRDGHAMDTD